MLGDQTRWLIASGVSGFFTGGGFIQLVNSPGFGPLCTFAGSALATAFAGWSAWRARKGGKVLSPEMVAGLADAVVKATSVILSEMAKDVRSQSTPTTTDAPAGNRFFSMAEIAATLPPDDDVPPSAFARATPPPPLRSPRFPTDPAPDLEIPNRLHYPSLDEVRAALRDGREIRPPDVEIIAGRIVPETPPASDPAA